MSNLNTIGISIKFGIGKLLLKIEKKCNTLLLSTRHSRFFGAVRGLRVAGFLSEEVELQGPRLEAVWKPLSLNAFHILLIVSVMYTIVTPMFL